MQVARNGLKTQLSWHTRSFLRTVSNPAPGASRPPVSCQYLSQEAAIAKTARQKAHLNAAVAPSRPTQLAQGIWQAYLDKLNAAPLTTKAITAWFGASMGDVLAQACAGLPFDLARNLRLGAFALCAGGPLGHYWHRFLDRTVMPHRPGSMRAVLTKLAADQLLLTPVFTAVFLAYIKISEGRADLVGTYLGEKLVKTLKANYALWPVANLIAFRFVPGDLRILYCNAIGILWGAYISVLCYATGAPAVVQTEVLETQAAHSVAGGIA